MIHVPPTIVIAGIAGWAIDVVSYVDLKRAGRLSDTVLGRWVAPLPPLSLDFLAGPARPAAQWQVLAALRPEKSNVNIHELCRRRRRPRH